MKKKYPNQSLVRLLLILSLSVLVACTPKEEAKPDPMTGGALIGVNYTKNYIHRFSVDKSGGSGLNRYSISGDFCCTMYPRLWTPDLRVKVEWTTSNGDPKSNDATAIVHTKTIPIEPYSELGRVYLVFLPKDEVRLYISKVGPKNINFPSQLGFPEEPAKSKGTKP